MDKYLRCYDVYKEMIPEITKQRVAMITMTIVLVMDVKKVANKLSGPFAQVGAQQADSDSIKPLNIFHKNAFFG